MTSNAQNQNPLLLPEIAQHIALFAGYRGQRNLAYTCKPLFSSVAPVIWKEIPDFMVIINLIPGVKLIEGPGSGMGSGGITRTRMVMTSDDSLLEEDWTRYWFYAPFVQHVTPFSNGDTEYCRIQNPRFLFTKLNRGPLLPNLRELTFYGLFGHSDFDCLVRFALCLSPTLQRLSLVDISDGPKEGDIVRPLWLLLGILAKSFSASNSNTPSNRVSWDPFGGMLASLCPSDYQEGLFLFDNLPAPTGLQYLNVRLPQTWRKAIYILGYLPLLEELEITFYDTIGTFTPSTPDSDEILLPPDSFPSLRRLRLPCLDCEATYHQLWTMKPMFSRILLLSIDTHLIDYSPESERSNFNFPQVIYQNCPNVEALSIEVGYDTQPLELMLDLLSNMPLKALFLWLDMDNDLVVEHPATYLWGTYPQLRCLSLLNIFGVPELKLLPKIAKACPNLERLRINFSGLIDPYEQPIDMDTGCVDHTAHQLIEIESHRPAGCPSNTGGSFQERWITSCHNLSSFLKAIWPNASFIPLSYEEFTW